ncbi:FAD-binding protein [Ramlibacter algicola]|uniref:FAD-binding oxidoreductase n=1 Tax=Ramlibacter algicola TaxID=2795217 RepID=A0A934Q3B1_9BURK|nr:FAD-binding oxidoreductase [Ramlibacter algicola]MBK0393756.1 FAD-binding oxidoreductase [Ramlibacter algicola]
MMISGWGGYPVQDARVLQPLALSGFRECLEEPFIARGMGRSYGDSATAATVAQTGHVDRFIAFDEGTGLLTGEAGLTLRDILRRVVPRGWFLPVTPGTSYVTLAGAVASDVHGKNHHVAGTFGQHVVGLTLMLGTGEVVTASPSEHADLFHATCGGMGLTGVILTVTVRLIPIRSAQIRQSTLKATCLEHACELLDAHAGSTYSVAWIDCLASGKSLGRSVLALGEHAEEGGLAFQLPEPADVPFHAPSQVLNKVTMRAFNAVHYGSARPGMASVPFFPFFYPLDAVGQWNRLYGRRGFVQYQFALPRAGGLAVMRRVLEEIAGSGRASFLAVLKQLGPQNDNLLSFPIEGYTLALDFQLTATTVAFLRGLDDLVTAAGGRIYLAKDAVMAESTFKAGYPRWRQFEAVREKYGAIGRFRSAQSRRLGLQ